MSHPLIDWNLAERVAVRVGGREPFSSSYHYAGLDPDFERFTAQAEELVGIETGLRSLSGPARVVSPPEPGGSGPTSRRSSACSSP